MATSHKTAVTVKCGKAGQDRTVHKYFARVMYQWEDGGDRQRDHLRVVSVIR